MNNNQAPGGVPFKANINVNPNDIANMRCTCGNDIFVPVMNLKFVSAFITGAGKPAGIKVEMLACLGCGILYPAVMDQSDVKKHASKPDVARLNFQALIAGVLQKIMLEGGKKDA